MRRFHAALLLSLTLIAGALLPVQSERAERVAVGDMPPGGDIIADNSENRSLDAALQAPSVDDLWVDAARGNDANVGRTSAAAFRTIQKAADTAGPGTTVHILPGIYREAVQPALSGSQGQPVVYRAENGPGTVMMRGSEPSASLSWTQLAANTIGLPAGVDPTRIYYADLSAWNLSEPPRFLIQLDGTGSSEVGGGEQELGDRLPLAREPDWQVVTEWKHAEYWWAADGGSRPAACNPATNSDHNCDMPQRSRTQLTDRTNDAEPAGIEAGNLTTLGNLTGATLVAMDAATGHYVYRRAITAHDVANGRISVDEACEQEGNPGLGWGSKYFVEGKPGLLDTPGEWWYDATTKRLYLWPPTPDNPAALNIEISRHDDGFSLQDRSYIILDGLTIEFFNGSAVHQRNWITEKSYNNTVRNAVLRYANWGVFVNQEWRVGSPPGNLTDGFTLENSTIAYIDTHAIRLIDQWDDNSAADSFTRSGITNVLIRNNEVHHVGFRCDADDADGIMLTVPNKLRFEGNHVHDVAHNGVLIEVPVIQSPKTYGFAPSEIKTGDILVLNNIVERACELATDCGAVKFWGYPPDNHVFRDLLFTGNIVRNTFGWTYISEKRQLGASGYGLFVDYASGIHAYRNIAYNNSFAGYYFFGTWRDGDIVFYNNIAANSLFGISLGSPSRDTHGSVNTQLVNNIIVNNEYYGIRISSADGNYPNTTINHNLYFNNGWTPNPPSSIWKPGAMMAAGTSSSQWYQTLGEIQANTVWEAQGMEGDPVFWSYNLADHDPHDGSWPDFHLTAASANAIDKGTTTLPPALTALLNRFGVHDWHAGTAYDIGRHEGGFELLADPPGRSIEPGGTARYSLRVDPSDLPYAVTLTATSPSPDLFVALSPTVLAPGATATLIAADGQVGTSEFSRWYTVPITGAGGGFTRAGHVTLLVNGAHVYLPLVLRN
jgi:hypothetical protein